MLLQIECNFKNMWYIMVLMVIASFMFSATGITSPTYISPTVNTQLLLHRKVISVMNVTHLFALLTSLMVCSFPLLMEFQSHVDFHLTQPFKRSEYAIALWSSTIIPSISSSMIIPLILSALVISPSYSLTLIPCMLVHLLSLMLFLTQVYSIALMIICAFSLRRSSGLIFAIIGFILMGIAYSVDTPYLKYLTGPELVDAIKYLIFSLIPSIITASTLYAKIMGVYYYSEVLMESILQIIATQVFFTSILMVASISIFDRFYEVK